MGLATMLSRTSPHARILALIGVASVALSPVIAAHSTALELAASELASTKVMHTGIAAAPASTTQTESAAKAAATAPSTPSPLTCGKGDTYTLNPVGEVYKTTNVDYEPGTIPNGARPVITFTGGDKNPRFTGLAIGGGGVNAYAISRSGGAPKDADSFSIHRWDVAAGAKTLITAEPTAFAISSKEVALAPAAIAYTGVNPYEAGHPFYFAGAVEGPGGATYIDVNKLDETGDAPTIVHVGYLRLAEKPIADDGGGRLSFSASGALSLVWDDADTGSHLISIRAAQVQAATGGEIPVDTNEPIATSASQEDGVATCATALTLELEGTVTDRVQATDQLSLTVSDPRRGVLGTVTSTGEAATTHIGPLTIEPGTAYELKVAPADPSTRRSDYKASFACQNSTTLEPVPTVTVGSSTTQTLSLPGEASGNVICTYTISPKPTRGSLTWQNTSSATGDLLAGSSWSLIPDDGAAAIAVTDNTGQPNYDGQDRDPVAGRFMVEQLVLGGYALEQVSAASGFLPATAPEKVELSADASAVDLGLLANSPELAAATWQASTEDGEELGGTAWLLAPTKADGRSMRISDCGSGICPTGGDEDNRLGHFKVNGLAPGDYTLTQVAVPKGRVLDSTSHGFRVGQDWGAVQIGGFTNEAITSVSWSKVANTADGQPLGGSVWTWKAADAAGQTMEVSDCVAKTAATCQGPDRDPAAGEFTLEGIAPGEYSLAEKEAPRGYILDSTQHQVSVTAEDLGQSITAGVSVSHRGTGAVTWSKIDADTGRLQPGTTWKLSGPDLPAETVVTDCVSTPCGTGAYQDTSPVPGAFRVTGLPWSTATYSLLETTGGAAAAKNASARSFHIDEGTPERGFRAVSASSAPATPGSWLVQYAELALQMTLLGLSGLALVGTALRRRHLKRAAR